MEKLEDHEENWFFFSGFKCYFGPLSIYLVSFWSQNLGWCVVDDHEEKDGRRRNKINTTNPNVFLNYFDGRDQNR
jgi:hypothetical protein